MAFIHVSRPGPDGRYSLGASVMHMEEAIRKALVIAEINSQQPYTYGHATLSDHDIDIAIETDVALPEERGPQSLAIDKAIAGHVSSFIEEKGTLQICVGAVPEAIAGAFPDRRDLGIHSEMIGEGLPELVRQGVATSSRKTIDQATRVSGIHVGTSDSFAWANAEQAMAASSAGGSSAAGSWADCRILFRHRTPTSTLSQWSRRSRSLHLEHRRSCLAFEEIANPAFQSELQKKNVT